MAGMKFGSTGKESLTWATNTYLPGMVAQKYRNSKIVAFSTGNVYGMSPIVLGGSIETDQTKPDGDYAQSCLGRERILEHFSRTLSIPMSIIRLNYAVELRYGVLVDLAKKVFNESTIDLTMGAANVIWQGDANAMTLMSFDQASTPPFILNVAGPEIISTRRVCEEFGNLIGKTATFTGTEAQDALLSNGQLGHKLYGYPKVSVKQMMEMIADWVMRGGDSLGKPTSFETRDGKF
jgi:nucleoside-diphosphate-sugar epimerase